jgi:hypothetical protein
MEQGEQQKKFFQHIKSVLPANISLVDEIAELLNISIDSSYRRIRGEKSISFEEIQALCKHFHISFDRLMDIHSDCTVFYGKNIDNDNFVFENYLKEILFNLKQFSKANHKMLYYEAQDIPLFHHFQFPELAAFKYFFWMKSVFYYPAYNKMHFEDCEFKDILIETGKEIIQVYNQIPSAELWVHETINSSIRQIEYYTYTGVIKNKDTIALLYHQLQLLIEHIREQAEQGEKFLIGEQPKGNKNNYQLYYNEVYLGHNAILVETDGILTSFINHAVLNFMFTHDDSFCQYSKEAMVRNMKKSILISTVSEKERNQFFNKLMNNITKSKVETLK